MRTSDSIEHLAAALAAAQSEIRPALKDANNPAFGSKYADLGAVFDAVRPAMAKHGLSVVQMPEHSDDALLHLTTRIVHKSGQWIEGTMSIPVSKVNAHGYGSAITYARRYALSAALGIIADEDDDGNKAAEAASPIARIKAAGMNGADVNKEAFDALGDEAQAYITEYAGHIKQLFADGGDVHGYLQAHTLDSDEKMALWSLLPSNIRSALKRAKAEMQPTKDAA